GGTATNRAGYLFHCTSGAGRIMHTVVGSGVFACPENQRVANCRKQGILRFAEVPRSAAKPGLKTIGHYPRAQSDDERGARRRETNRSRTVNLPSHYRNRVVKLCIACVKKLPSPMRDQPSLRRIVRKQTAWAVHCIGA